MSDHEYNSFNKQQKLEYIIDLISMEEFEKASKYKADYECEFKTSFDFDHKRYDYAFLEFTTKYEAVRLYDNLSESSRDIFVKVIAVDHEHLIELVHIHKTVQTFNTEVHACITS